MSDTALTTTSDKLEHTSHLDPLTETERALVECMAWEGRSTKAAAKVIGISERWARELIRRPDVLKALKSETHVLRTSARPIAINALIETAQQKRHLTARVAAARALDGDPDMRSSVQVNVNVTPGYVLDVRDHDRGPIIDADEVIRIDGTEPEAG